MDFTGKGDVGATAKRGQSRVEKWTAQAAITIKGEERLFAPRNFNYAENKRRVQRHPAVDLCCNRDLLVTNPGRFHFTELGVDIIKEALYQERSLRSLLSHTLFIEIRFLRISYVS